MAPNDRTEEKMTKLKATRGQLKGTVTRMETFVNNPVSISSATTEMLETRLEKLHFAYNEYEKVQVEILSISEDDEDVSTMEGKYFDVVSKLKANLKRLQSTESQRSESVSTSKLPSIEIPIFTGKDFTKYLPFMDLFTAVIHNNTSLSDVQKLFYLRKYLTDEALGLIVNLPLENKSYKEALALLKKRFDNKTRLIFNHINVILQLPVMQRGTAASIRSFISEFQQQLYALKNLQQPVEKWDMLLITILTKKLDTYTNRAYQLERDTELLPTMTEFVTFLERRASALEDSAIDNNSKSTTKVVNVVTNISCTYCKASKHPLYMCPKFKTAPIDDRKKFVKSENLCGSCLKSVHAGRCKYSFPCKICRDVGHNTLLHKDIQKTKDIPENKDGVALISNNWSMSKTKLIPTIRVKLVTSQGSELCVRAALDTASEVSLITSDQVNNLGLKSQSHKTNIIGVGNTKNSVAKKVTISILLIIKRPRVIYTIWHDFIHRTPNTECQTVPLHF
ncbi:hypothetical protein NE865_09652 [Phthorimaea operculella]|nr:hypothetical protein NE865_09652 [Phthorimaea operculella]